MVENVGGLTAQALRGAWAGHKHFHGQGPAEASVPCVEGMCAKTQIQAESPEVRCEECEEAAGHWVGSRARGPADSPNHGPVGRNGSAKTTRIPILIVRRFVVCPPRRRTFHACARSAECSRRVST
jgi:hypothetical protein